MKRRASSTAGSKLPRLARTKKQRTTASLGNAERSIGKSDSQHVSGDTSTQESRPPTLRNEEFPLAKIRPAPTQRFALKQDLYPQFIYPTRDQCVQAFQVLDMLHGDQVRENFADPDAPAQEYPYVMDALVVAALSQATSWNNAKRAMKSMKAVYGSSFAYQAIVNGGIEKLQQALRPGGMQNRKAKLLMKLLEDIRKKYGKWDLQHLFQASDEEVITEVTKFWGIGPKCAHCLLSICLKRDVFAVDTHVYRLSGLWGWRPKEVSRELAQRHLDFRIPDDLKYALHYQMIVHGRECPRCRGNGVPTASCEFQRLIKSKSMVAGN